LTSVLPNDAGELRQSTGRCLQSA